jgi:hypothetical protein
VPVAPVLNSFNLTPASGITPATSVAPTVVVSANGALTLQALTVAVRDAAGNAYDFTGALNNVALTTTPFTFKPDARVFPAGTYTATVSYELNNTWFSLSPSKTFTVAAVVQANGMILNSFNVSPSNNLSSSSVVTAQTNVSATAPITLQALTVSVKDASGASYDFSGAINNLVIGSNGFTFTPNTRKFAPGTYTASVSYEYKNTWVHLSPSVTFTVN